MGYPKFEKWIHFQTNQYHCDGWYGRQVLASAFWVKTQVCPLWMELPKMVYA
jgi:hypothetical protein